MKRFGAILAVVVILSIVAFSMGSSGDGQDADVADAAPVTFSITPPHTANPAKKPPQAGAELSVAADPDISLYFFPRDTAATTTVFYVANPTHRTVTIRGWAYDWGGSIVASPLEGTIDPGMMGRFYSDDAAVATGITWNMGSDAAYVELTLPPDVVVDGYIAWNSASQYDPDIPMNRIPLRFSNGPIR